MRERLMGRFARHAERGGGAVESKDISVVVQGPIVGPPGDPHEQRLTLRCMESVRRYLPGAEVVLSTWEGSDVAELPFDRLVQSADPGALLCGSNPWVPSGVPFNANRQIISTREGLRAATRPYAMKLRSDLLLTGTGFLRYFGRHPARNEAWRILHDRVVASTCFSRNPHGRLRYAFHPSDWFHFGRREDVLNLWNVPLAPEPEIPRWHDTYPHHPDDLESWALYRYTVEQYIWLSFLRKHGPVRFEHKLDSNPEAIALSELTIANNLVLVDPDELGIEFTKYRISVRTWATLYTHGEWYRLYRTHCDPNARVPPDMSGWMKDAYGLVAPAHLFLVSPRSSPWGRALSEGWEARFPGAFRAAKRVYLSGLTALERVRGG